MRKLLLPALFALAVGFVLAHFTVLFFNQWYFAEFFWLKVGLLTPLTGLVYGLALNTTWRWAWLCLGCYWLILHLGWVIYLQVPDLRDLTFAGGLNFETAFLWPVALTLALYGGWKSRRTRMEQVQREQDLSRELKLRYRHKRLDPISIPEHLDNPVNDDSGIHQVATEAANSIERVCQEQAVNPSISLTVLLIAGICGTTLSLIGWFFCPAHAQEITSTDNPNPNTEPETAPSSDAEPGPLVPDRHSDLTKPESEPGWPQDPGLPPGYAIPMHLQAKQTCWVVIENWRDGLIIGVKTDELTTKRLGRVLAPVSQVNRQGFTASGWAVPGTVCATAVNAIHLKTDHDYEKGRGVIFSLLPIEFAEFDPGNYTSYFNQSSSLFTDIPAGTGLFGGEWAPLVGNRILIAEPSSPQPWLQSSPVEPGWIPEEGQVIVIEVIRRKYNPEWIEFENRFGGIIWVKELGMDAYPIGQVLKPVAGTGRFLGSTYADIGRIRANHPGVLCISTSPDGLVGGFQIIPRDHAMSSEMNNARLRTQWMVVGPLWALDQSWEGSPPLFNEYLYPAFTPALNSDYSKNEEVSGAEVFLNRFTARGRYSDADNSEEYILLRQSVYYDDDALVNLTHLRIYFPRI